MWRGASTRSRGERREIVVTRGWYASPGLHSSVDLWNRCNALQLPGKERPPCVLSSGLHQSMYAGDVLADGGLRSFSRREHRGPADQCRLGPYAPGVQVEGAAVGGVAQRFQ